jgi:hypothetical protein
MATKEFVDYKAQLLGSVREESIKMLGESLESANAA